MLLTGMPIFASAAPNYWGYDSYDTIQNPGVEDITSYPTTVKKVSATEYAMSCTTKAGVVTITLKERAWGMFNLASWTMVDTNGKNVTFHSGTTDWEYVYRTRPSATGDMVYSGGNHGNEILVSLDFYNGDTEQKINLSTGQSATANKIHVIEKSKLLIKPATGSDAIGFRDKNTDTYKESEVYATVTRKYTFTGPQVKLNVDYNYLKEVYYDLSYTCMFPISKEYGRYCDMYDKSGNKIKHIETYKTGSYSGTTHNKNAATRAHIYGDADKRYQFNVTVNTLADSVNNFSNDYKTSFWDMNSTTNKLYFSKFEQNSPTKVAAGSQLHTETVWQFVFDEDGDPSNNMETTPSTIDKNLASGKTYTLSGLYPSSSNASYPDENGKTMTDCVIAPKIAKYDHATFAGLNKASSEYTANGYASITVDLNENYSMDKFVAYVGSSQNGAAGIGAPTEVSVYVSDDKQSWSLAGKTTPVDNAAVSYIAATVSLDKYVTGRYVQFRFVGSKNWMLLSEIAVYEANTSKLGTNIVLGKEYSGTHNRSEYYANLTDGKAKDSISFVHDEWFGFYYHTGLTNEENLTDKNSNAPNGIGTVAFDLDGKYDLTHVRVNTFLGNYSGISAPYYIAVETSDSGTDYKEVARQSFTEVTSDSADAKKVSWIEFNLSDVTANYVRLIIDTRNTQTFINEIEVYGVAAKADEPESSEPETSEPETSEPETSEPETSEDDTSADVPGTAVDNPTGTNVALNKPYTGGDVAIAHPTFSANLTDGKKSNVGAYDSSWFGFWYNKDATVPSNNCPDGVGTVVIDLGEITDNLNAVRVHMWGCNASGIMAPESIVAYVSEDGTDYTELGSLVLPEGDDPAWASLALDDVSAQYVKLVFKVAGTWTFINEIEIYADDETPETSEPETSEPETSEPEASDDEIADIDEDGDIDAADYVLVKRSVLKTYTLSEKQTKVADVDKDNDVDATDYVLVKRIVLGTYKIK